MKIWIMPMTMLVCVLVQADMLSHEIQAKDSVDAAFRLTVMVGAAFVAGLHVGHDKCAQIYNPPDRSAQIYNPPDRSSQ